MRKSLEESTGQRRRLLVALPVMACLLPGPPVLANAPASSAAGAPRELLAEWTQAHLQGRGRLRFLGLHVYDIRLWTTEPDLAPDSWPQRPIALEIQYARSFGARAIADRSLDEMRRAGPLPPDLAERWLRTLEQVFPDVKPGDRLTGVQRPEGVARFFHNGQWRGEVRDAEFTRRFFGIWLGDSSSEPALREALLGRR